MCRSTDLYLRVVNEEMAKRVVGGDCVEREVVCGTGTKSSLQQEQSHVASQQVGWRDFVTVTKPGILRSNLLSTAVGFWLAVHSFQLSEASAWNTLFLFLYTCLGTTLVMASGTVLNNYLDRDLDRLMERTKNRPSVQRMKPKTLLSYGLVLGILGVIVLSFVNILSAVLGFLGIFSYVVVYTALLKRTSTLNTVVGGIPGSIPPMIGWCAVSGTLDAAAWILFAFVFLWQPPHFLALAMLRAEEYKHAGFKMLPQSVDDHESKWQILLWVAALVPSSLLFFLLPNIGYIYLTVAVVLGSVYVYCALQGVLGKAKDGKRWAGKMFGYSLMYLVVIYAALFIDAVL